MDRMQPDRPSPTSPNPTPIFATPVFRHHFGPDQIDNDALQRTIMQAKSRGNEDPKDIIGGWSSTKDLHDWPGPDIQAFTRCALQKVDNAMMAVSTAPPGELHYRWQVEAWANVSARGHYHNIHSHPNSAWSGVYYVATGVPDDGRALNGVLEFIDPRAAVDAYAYAGSPFLIRSMIAPQAGLMVIFPSWLKHMVHPFHGEGERISIAFNAAPIISER